MFICIQYMLYCLDLVWSFHRFFLLFHLSYGDYDINENDIKELDRVFGEYKKGGYTITRPGNKPENVNGKANE